MLKLTSLVSILLCFLSCSPTTLANPVATAPEHQPTAPGLTFLYTCFVECVNPLYRTEGPTGLRTTIPIIGGNVTGPRIKGHFRDVGADWGTTDVQTGIFSADTRYNLLTDDGANVFLQTSGPTQPNGDLHLRVIFQTGDKKYYWLNNVVAVGVLSQVSQGNETFVLRIDVWHLTSEWTSTTFVNGSTYA